MDLIILYFIFASVIFINISFSISVLDLVKQSITVKERTKLIEKSADLHRLRMYTLLWPYILYVLLKK